MSWKGPSLSRDNKQALAEYMANRYERSHETPRYCVCQDPIFARTYLGKRWDRKCERFEA